MKLAVYFFKLIRWPNLVFIVLTQTLFYYFIYLRLLPDGSVVYSFLFYLLVIASVFIAAGGYIINDYFDSQIDAVNKPGRVIIGKIIKRRWAILWHWILSGSGICISLFISLRTGEREIAIINILCVAMLWIYSTALKRKLLAGNIVIALLAAWVILSVYYFSGADIFSLRKTSPVADFNVRLYFKYAALYAGFAFIMTLIREVIKDIEDIESDRRYHCRTIPIVWGIPAAKIFTAVWLIVGIIGFAGIQLYAWQSGLRSAAVFNSLFIVVPMCVVLRKLYIARTTSDFHHLSTLVKWIMLAGIYQ